MKERRTRSMAVETVQKQEEENEEEEYLCS